MSKKHRNDEFDGGETFEKFKPNKKSKKHKHPHKKLKPRDRDRARDYY